MEEKIGVLIPAYRPDTRLVALVEALLAASLPVLVVDDGGGEAYRELFEGVERLGATVVRHAVNLGKGRALKTGINAALMETPGISGIITADADGQHTARDILRVREAMQRQPDALVIGARRFSGNVPLKSSAGNRITRVVYGFATGVRCTDTQTGLRGIPGHALPDMLTLSGERYEYEMNMLLSLRALSLPLVEVPIETIYIDDNRGSHFHPLRDAARIYSVILRFVLSSVLSFALDYGLFLLLCYGAGLPVWASYGIARAVSSAFNFFVNQSAVFGGRGGKWAIVRYYVLAALLMAVGMGLVEALSGALSLAAAWIKAPVDLLLFFVSFIAQRDIVFR